MGAKEVIPLGLQAIKIVKVIIPVRDPLGEERFYKNLFDLSLNEYDGFPIEFIGATTDAKAFEHLSLRVGSRAELGYFLRHLITAQIPILGAVDHIYQESVYLHDPEKNLIEVAAIRNRSDRRDEFENGIPGTRPFDYSGVYYEAENTNGQRETRILICHVALRVADMRTSGDFYEMLGFETSEGGNKETLLLTTDDCHHQIGLSSSNGIIPDHMTIFLGYPNCEKLAPVLAGLQKKGIPVTETERGYLVNDPSGNTLILLLDI